MSDHTGLKIPKSAITKKDFYVIPEDYLTQGGNSNSTGVLIDTGKENAEFQAVDIYYRDTQTGSVYVDPDDFEKNTIIDALAKYDGNKTKAAKYLGISRSLLYSKLCKYDIKQQKSGIAGFCHFITKRFI